MSIQLPGTTCLSLQLRLITCGIIQPIIQKINTTMVLISFFFCFCTGILQFWLSLDIFMTFPQCKKLALRHYRHLDNGNSRQICSYVFRCLLTGACSGFSWCLFFCLFVCVFQRWRKSDWIFLTNDLFRFGRWNILCPLNHSINWSLILLVLKFKFLFCKRLRLVISWLKKQTSWTI